MSPFEPLDHLVCLEPPQRLATSYHVEHVPFGMVLVDLVRPSVLVELGTHTGVSYCAFCQAVSALSLPTRCYAVDTWHGDPQAGFYGPEVLAELQAYHDPLYGSFSRLIQSSFDDALSHFSDRSIDLLHIDGFHTYDAVQHDFSSWLPKLSDGGVVLVHDINVREQDFGVWQLWEEVSRHYPHLELSHGNGLGLLAVGSHPPPALLPLLHASPSDLAPLRRFFHALGSYVAELDEAREIAQASIHASVSEVGMRAPEVRGNEQELADLRAQIVAWEEQWRVLERSHAWRLLVSLRRMRARVTPEGSHRETAWFAAQRTLRAWRQGAAMSTALPSHDGTRPGGDTDQYAEWRAEMEPTEGRLNKQRKAANRLAYRPRFALLVTGNGIDQHDLSKTLGSIGEQTYDNWEVLLITSVEHSSVAWSSVTEMSARTLRIREKFLDNRVKLSSSSEHASTEIGGDFVLCMDGGDLLAPNALFEAARRLNDASRTEILFFDEDEYSGTRETRSNPFFKPSWSPELLLSTDYLAHAAVRLNVWVAAKGICSEDEDAPGWGTMARCVERTDAIEHLPQVLYHRRKRSERADSVFPCRSALLPEARLHAIEAHLLHQGVQGAAATSHHGLVRVTWPVSGSRVSIIIPTKDRVQLLRRCLSSLLATTGYDNYEVLLLDTGSQESATQEYYDTLSGDSRIRILESPGPFNYSAANNIGARATAGDLLLFMNNDVEILEADWLEELVRWAERPQIGAVGAKLLFPNGTIQHAGIVIGLTGHAGHVFSGTSEHACGPFGSSSWYRNPLAVTGACMMVRRSAFDEVGGFDEQYELAFSDVTLCLHLIDRGYRNVYTPFARLLHHEGASRTQGAPAKDMIRGFKEMEEVISRGDPSFNPNLSLSTREPSLATRREGSPADYLRRLLGLN